MERQRTRQLPAEYVLLTFTLPGEFRTLVWAHQTTWQGQGRQSPICSLFVRLRLIAHIFRQEPEDPAFIFLWPESVQIDVRRTLDPPEFLGLRRGLE